MSWNVDTWEQPFPSAGPAVGAERRAGLGLGAGSVRPQVRARGRVPQSAGAVRGPGPSGCSVTGGRRARAAEAWIEVRGGPGWGARAEDAQPRGQPSASPLCETVIAFPTCHCRTGKGTRSTRRLGLQRAGAAAERGAAQRRSLKSKPGPTAYPRPVVGGPAGREPRPSLPRAPLPHTPLRGPAGLGCAPRPSPAPPLRSLPPAVSLCPLQAGLEAASLCTQALRAGKATPGPPVPPCGCQGGEDARPPLPARQGRSQRCPLGPAAAPPRRPSRSRCTAPSLRGRLWGRYVLLLFPGFRLEKENCQ